jgi:hypothetical protein
MVGVLTKALGSFKCNGLMEPRHKIQSTIARLIEVVELFAEYFLCLILLSRRYII